MQVLGLSKLSSEGTYIYYRRTYSATATLQLINSEANIEISFTIEIGPLGDKNIYVDIDPSCDIDYPLIPVKSALKTYILEMDNEGKLPCT